MLDGSDRTDRQNRGLRQYGGGHFRISQSHWVAGSSASGTVRGLYRLHIAASALWRFLPRLTTAVAPEKASISISRNRSALFTSLARPFSTKTVNGRVQVRAGNTDHVFAPHGVYPVAGEDKWIAIVCRTDDDWRRFCAAVGHDELAADSRYASIPSRLEHRETLDAIISEWSRDLEGPEMEHILQSRGIAAHRVQNSSDAYRDPQFSSRAFCRS